MQISYLVSLVSLLSHVSLTHSQLDCHQSGYPDCFCHCFASLVVSYCPTDLFACPCTNTQFLKEISSCVVSSCTTAEVETSQNIAEAVCKEDGFPLPIIVWATPSATTTSVMTPTATVAAATSTAAGGVYPSNEKKGGLGAGAIAGIAVGVVGVIAIGVVIIYLVLRYRRQSQASPPPPPPPLQDLHLPSYKPELDSVPVGPYPSQPPMKPMVAELDWARQTFPSTQRSAQWQG